MTLLTVIVTTRNRCHRLEGVLGGLLHQKTQDAFDFEILFVDNNSSDKTREVIENFSPFFRGRLRLLSESQKGKAYAANRAIQESRGEILAFTDDDTVLDAWWLLNIWQCFRQYPCDGLGGRVLAQYPQDTPRWIIDNADILSGPIVRYDYGQDIKPYTKSMFEFVGANCAFKRSLFSKHGLLSVDLGPGSGVMGDDTEIVKRFVKAGSGLYYCGKAVVWHPVDIGRMNLKYIGLWNMGLGRFRVIVDEKDKIDQRCVRWFGIPRWLYREMLRNILSAMGHVLNRRRFLMAWIDLWRNVGRARELKEAYVHQRYHSHL